MKRVFFILSAVLALGARADLGNGTGTGGNGLAIEFISRANTLVWILYNSSAPRPLLTRKELVQLQARIQDTRVVVVEGPLLDNTGARVEARNVDDPQHPGHRQIELLESAWKNYFQTDSITSYRLVLHEYLRLLPKNDDNARLSSRLSFNVVEFAAAQKHVADGDELTDTPVPATGPTGPGFQGLVFSNTMPAVDFADAAFTPDGGAIAVGQGGGDSYGTKPPFQAFVAKFAKDGSVEWKLDKPYAALPDYFWEDLRTVIVLPDGGYLVGGYASGRGGVNGPTSGMIAKIRKDGLVEWQKLVPGYGGDVLRLTVAHGEIFAAGVTTIDDQRNGGWIAKLSNTGESLWRLELGTIGTVTALEPNEEGVTLAGSSGVWHFAMDGASMTHVLVPSSFDVYLPTAKGSGIAISNLAADTLLHKECNIKGVTADGAALSVAVAKDLSCTSVAALPGGGFLVAGEGGEQYAGRTTAELLKFDASWHLDWRMKMHSNSELRRVKLGPNGNFLLVGTQFQGDIGRGWVFMSDKAATEFQPPPGSTK